MNLTTKQKGNIAELSIAADLAQKGYTVAIPYGEYGVWDLLVDRNIGIFEKVQIKYAAIKNGCIPVRNRCNSVSSGKIQSTYKYNNIVDWIGVYEPVNKNCYYISVKDLKGELLTLRVKDAIGTNKSNIKWAKNYQFI